MYQDAIMGDYDMEMMGYKLEMKCDKDAVPIQETAGGMWGEWMSQSAVKVASGVVSVVAIMSSVY